MLISDILVTILGSAAWCGSLVLYLLVRAQGATRAPILRHYLGLKLVAWSVLVLLETAWYLNINGWMEEHWELYQDVHRMAFRLLMAMASWILVKNLLVPIKLSTEPEPLALIEMNVLGHITSWNAHATDLFGWEASEVIGRELAEVIVPESHREAHRQGLQHFRETGNAPILDARYTQTALTKSGGRILVDIGVTQHLTSHGTIFLGRVTPALRIQ